MGAEQHIALVGRECTQQKFDDGGFPYTVAAHDANSVPPLDNGGKILHHRLLTVSEGDAPRFGNASSRTVGLFQTKASLTLRRAALRAFIAHGFECPDPTFVSCSSGFNALPDPCFLLSKLFVKEGLCSRRCLGLLLPQNEKFGVICLPQRQVAPVELADAIADPLQKTPIVGDEYDGTVKCSNLLLQPIDGGDIEMVGRFVQ